MTMCIRHQGSDSPAALMSSVRPLPRASGYNVSSKAGRGEAGISNGQLCWHSVSSALRGGRGSLLACLRLLSCRTRAPRALPSSPGALSRVSLCWAPPTLARVLILRTAWPAAGPDGGLHVLARLPQHPTATAGGIQPAPPPPPLSWSQPCRAARWPLQALRRARGWGLAGDGATGAASPWRSSGPPCTCPHHPPHCCVRGRAVTGLL